MYYEKEHWKPRTTFRCTTMQVYDPCMEPDRRIHHRRQHGHLHAYLHRQRRYFDKVLGCFWRIADHCHEIAEHNHYVQGVAWDPLNEYIATQSSDRSTHVYNIISRTPSTPSGPRNFRRESTASETETESVITSVSERLNDEVESSSSKDQPPALLTPTASVVSTPIPAFILQWLKRPKFACQLYPLRTFSIAHTFAPCNPDGTIDICQAVWRRKLYQLLPPADV
ncbi:hypothetical protein L227DRAFT_653342 [Lentinus tigrinus ALCF2SS1-6]|uniref:Uncharacterized protein n=1 Tax=Lentinus tigrinus ALCF2SS1-6 TaxID=1328759 RepID=A0A5C2SAD7_9APHY|nr:hypothetical protein L227DRAFT_653342 [Lentinus tigrinus ALCF2SS1-6]